MLGGEPLQLVGAEVRNDLPFGELPISFEGFGGLTVRAGEPRPQIFGNRRAGRIGQGARVLFAEKAGELLLRVLV